MKSVEEDLFSTYYEHSGMLDLVGRGSAVKGTLVIGLLTRIDGEVEGEIRGADPARTTVIVGRTGLVKGQIIAGRVIINGEVEGRVQATDRIRISPNGTFIGSLEAPKIIIERGAFIDGEFQMKLPSDNPLHSLP